MKVRHLATCAIAFVGLLASNAGLAKEPDFIDANFSGPAGWNIVDGSSKVIAVQVKEDEAFAEREIKFARTGIMVNEVSAGGMIVTGRVKAGEPIYAVELDGYGTGWCSVGKEKTSRKGTVKAKKGTCFFVDREDDNRLFQTGGNDGKSAYWSTAVTGQMYVKQPIRIEEKPVDFERRFTVKVDIEKVRKGKLRIAEWFDDGINKTMLSLREVKETDGVYEFALWGGVLRLEPNGKSFSVKQVEPISDEPSQIPTANGLRIYESSGPRIIFI